MEITKLQTGVAEGTGGHKGIYERTRCECGRMGDGIDESL